MLGSRTLIGREKVTLERAEIWHLRSHSHKSSRIWNFVWTLSSNVGIIHKGLKDSQSAFTDLTVQLKGFSHGFKGLNQCFNSQEGKSGFLWSLKAQVREGSGDPDFVIFPGSSGQWTGKGSKPPGTGLRPERSKPPRKGTGPLPTHSVRGSARAS